MTISRDSVLRGVEQYLPRTVNFARSEVFGTKDPEAIFARIMQIVLSALLVDEDVVFYVIYLAAQRLLARIDDVLATLDAISGETQLRAISGEDPVRVTDFTDLTKARIDLLELSGSLAVTNQFGTVHFTNFKTDIESFLTNQIKPNVLGGNRAKIESDLRASMESLASSWAEVLLRRDMLFEVLDKYQSTDIRAKSAASVISAISEKLREIQSTLPTLTTVEQAKRAEQIFTDLVAAEAALKVLGEAPPVLGTLISGPAQTGYTQDDYLEAVGTASTEPVLPIFSGLDGQLDLDSVLVSTTGQVVNQALPMTSELEDPGVPDFTVSVSAGMFLTFVDTGRAHEIVSVSPTKLTLRPTTPYQASAQRYAVTQTAPGTRFKSLSSSFWTVFPANGQTRSTVIDAGLPTELSGSAGSWVKPNKATGVDGTNLKASGLAGVARPKYEEGSDGACAAGGVLTSVSAAFLTSGVVAGHVLVISGGANSGSYTITSVDSETQVTVSSPFPLVPSVSEAFYVENANAASHFVDSAATFLTAGISGTDSITLYFGANPSWTGTWGISSVESQTSLFLDLSPFLFIDTGISWYVAAPVGVFFSPSSTFLSSGVSSGDTLDISGVGTFTIVSVDSQTQVTVSGAIPALTLGPYAFAIYSSAGSVERFTQSDGLDFLAAGVGPFVPLTEGTTTTLQPAILKVSGVDHSVIQTTSSSSLTATPAEPVASGLPWSLRAGDVTRIFSDALVSPFLSFSAGDTLVLFPGTPSESRSVIQEVLSASTVLLCTSVPQGLSAVPYAVINTVKAGQDLVALQRRYKILSVLSQNTLLVSPALPTSTGKNVSFYVIPSGAGLTTTRLVDTAANFSLDVEGSSIDIMAERPIRAVVESRISPTEILISKDLKLGQRDLPYRIILAREFTSRDFQYPAAVDPAAAVGDFLSVWRDPEVRPATSVAWTLGVQSVGTEVSLPARAADVPFALTRGGSRYYGQYLIFDLLNSMTLVSASTSELRVRVAEVLIDFGTVAIPVVSGGPGAVVLDPDGLGTIFEDLSASFVASGVQVGSRLTVTFAGGAKKTYVTSVSPTSLRVDPPLPDEPPVSWQIDETSVSESLREVEARRADMINLRDVVSGYVVPRNNTVARVLELLRAHGMDRAAELLLDGKIDEFIAVTAPDASYSSRARSTTQTVGRATVTSSATKSRAAGPPLDRTVGGSVSTSGTSRGSTEPAGVGVSSTEAVSYSGTGLSEDVEIRVAMAKGLTDIASDERLRSVLQVSLEELRNLAIYELTGEIEGGVVTDEDPTLPWIAKTGSLRDRLVSRKESMLAAIQYMIDHPGEFDDVGTGT